MQQLKQDPGSSPRNIHNSILSSFAGTKVSTQVKNGNFSVSLRFLEHCPVTSPLINHKEVIHPAALTPNFAYKNFTLKTTGKLFFFFNASHSFSLCRLAIKLSLHHTLVFWFVWPHCALGTEPCIQYQFLTHIYIWNNLLCLF